jgi:hypothetical protein
MDSPRSFISFDFDHNETDKHLFIGQAKNSKTPFTISDWSSKASLPQSQWEKLIEEKVSRCNLVIVLVGKNMASAAGVAKEVAFARKNNVPFFGIYVGGANQNSNLPDGLARNRTIRWDWENIARAINQMMREGKNK